MLHELPVMLKLLHQHDAQTLFNPAFFELRTSGAVDSTFIAVKPVAQFEDGTVEPRYNVGTRGNGTDRPVWPDDLCVEVV